MILIMQLQHQPHILLPNHLTRPLLYLLINFLRPLLRLKQLSIMLPNNPIYLPHILQIIPIILDKIEIAVGKSDKN